MDGGRAGPHHRHAATSQTPGGIAAPLAALKSYLFKALSETDKGARPRGKLRGSQKEPAKGGGHALRDDARHQPGGGGVRKSPAEGNKKLPPKGTGGGGRRQREAEKESQKSQADPDREVAQPRFRDSSS